MSKRKLESFFKPSSGKKPRSSNISSKDEELPADIVLSHHKTYPFPVPHLPPELFDGLSLVPAKESRIINNQADLDLLYFEPFIPSTIERQLFRFLRQHLFFYRVNYKVTKFGKELDIKTPRYTTVFGVDTSSKFTPDSEVIDSQTLKPVPKDRYKVIPRPLPRCLDHLRQLTEVFTGTTFNFCLVNYYANGSDSISYHSDDERFLGPDPAIASFSLGGRRDFMMKHKPIIPRDGDPPPPDSLKTPLKLPLASGDMVLMRGKTQANWLHSIPKRSGAGCGEGRINITFRKGVKPYATENYNQYNVGTGPVFKWNQAMGEMRLWTAEQSQFAGPSS